jgi:hypothetical protein
MRELLRVVRLAGMRTPKGFAVVVALLVGLTRAVTAFA